MTETANDGPVAALLRSLLPPGVALATSDPRASHPPLPGMEAEAMVNARPVRVREFSAGRFAARRAMQSIGLPPLPIPMGQDRAPCWPAGLTGSITHNASLCLAAVGRISAVRAIGLDIEDDSPLPADLWPVICNDAERAWIARQPEPARGWSAKGLFCAKEATYKAQYTLSHQLIDFATLHVLPDPERGTFTAQFTKAVPPFAAHSTLHGHMARAGGHVLAMITLPPAG